MRFTTTAALVNELIEARCPRSLPRYSKVELLILDELAYVPLAPAETELVFQVLDQRSELSALIISTNLPFGEWTKVFPEQRLCKAVVDRLTFNAASWRPEPTAGDSRRPSSVSSERG